FTQGVESALELLCQVIEAEGVMLCWRSQASTSGVVPSQAVIDQICTHCSSTNEIWATDQLAAELPVTAGQPVCGCLAIPFEAPDLMGAIFFRREYTHEVVWGGDPNKAVEETPEGVRLSPRQSFDAWRETVRGRSRSWSPIDLEMADEMRSGMIEILSRRALQFARLNEELLQVNSDLDSFAYAASHDLKEPLRGINHSVYLLIEQLGEGATPEVLKRCDALTRLSRRLDELVNGLLRISRAGRGDLQMEWINLAEAVDESLDLATTEECRAGVTINVEPGAKLFGDFLGVRELLGNLIANAIKYNQQSEKVIEIGVTSRDALRNQDGRPAIICYVRDNGVGLDPQHFENVFQIFRRMHGDAFGAGTGAGLAIVKKIVQRHHGRVWLEQNSNEGLTVMFTLEPTT
ncbi:MAG: hypothetical protein KDA92_14920, partial [Planctomycetales bacterium]|nr:hypothetical protein [Planctomycetales bacterium]